MYAGKVVEYTDVKTLFKNPRHPYTWGLLNSIPRLDKEVDRLPAIPGMVPDSKNFPVGCRYNTRCPFATEKCFKEEPELMEVAEGHRARCWYADKLDELKNKVEDGSEMR